MDLFMDQQKKPEYKITTKQQVEEELAKKTRTAVDMKGMQQNFDADLSLEQTIQDTAQIQSLIEGLSLGTFDVKETEVKKMQLKALQGRNLSHLMLNEQKITGDSAEMQEVKEALKNLETVLTREKKEGITEDDIDFIEGMYQAAMASCQQYIKTKNPWTKTGKRRMAKVKATLDRLMQESSQLALGRLAFQQDFDKGDEPITVGIQLLTMGAMNEYFRGRDPKDQEKIAELSAVCDAKEKLFKETSNSVKAELNAEEKVFRDQYNILQWNIMHTQDSDPKYLEFKAKKEKKQEELDNLERDYLKVEKKIYILRDNQNKRAAADRRGKWGLKDKKIKAVETGEGEIKKLPKELQGIAKVLFSGESPSSLIKNTQKPTAAEKETLNKMLEVRKALSEFKPGVPHAATVMLAGTPVTFLQDRYGAFMMHTADATVPVAFEGELLSSLISKDVIYHPSLYGEDMAQLVMSEQKDDLSQMNKRELLNTREYAIELLHQRTGIEKSLMNNISASELKYLAMTTFDKSLSKKDVKNAIKQRIDEKNKQKKDTMINTVLNQELSMVGQSVSEGVVFDVKKEEKASGWSPDEEKVRNLMADVLFSEDTVEADALHYQPGERLKNVLAKNSYAIAVLISDQFTEKKEGEPGLIDKMIDSLPFFMMDGVGEGIEELKNGLKGAISSICDTIRNGLEESFENKEERETALKLLNVSNLLAPKIKEHIEGLSGDDFKELIAAEKTIDTTVTETMGSVQEAFDSCVDEIFSAKQEKQEKKAPQTKEERMAAIRQRMAEQKSELDKKLEPFLKIKKDYEKILQKDYKSLKGQEKNDYRTAEEYLPKIKEQIDNIKAETGAILDKILSDSAKGDKGQGLFIKKVLKTYFKDMPVMDQRSMLANAIKNSRPVPKPGEKLTNDEKLNYMSDILGGMFKGAGPLFQKMLQGLPASDFPEGLEKAISDTQDNLAHIPEKIVKSHMDGIIARSDGKIDKIVVSRSLGAASVGQAFLCKLYGPAIKDGKEVVIKILRPDCRNRMMREKEVMLNAAKMVDREGKTEDEIKEMEKNKQVGGMEATYLGNLQRIEEELDLTLEYQNCQKGAVYDAQIKGEKENLADSMKMSDLAAPTSDTCIMEMAGKKTLKRYISDIKETMYEKLSPFCELEKEIDGESGKETGRMIPKKNKDGSYVLKKDLTAEEGQELAEITKELEAMFEDCETRQEGMIQLSQKWVTEGVFEKGFYHGDLHAGNIMVSDKHKGVTAIDFGNATELNKHQQEHITRMMVAAGVGEVNIFLHSFHMLLQNTPEEVYQAKREELKLAFEEVLNLGDGTFTGQRIAVALLKAQELGLELPPVIANFSSCQLRLSNAVNSLNNTMKELHSNIIMLGSKKVAYDNRQTNTDPIVMAKRDMATHASKNGKQTSIKSILKNMEVTREEDFKKELFDSANREKFQKRYNLPVREPSNIKKDLDRIDEILRTGKITEEEKRVYTLSGSWESLFPNISAVAEDLQKTDPKKYTFLNDLILGNFDTIMDEISRGDKSKTIFLGAESKKINSLSDLEKIFATKGVFRFNREEDFSGLSINAILGEEKETEAQKLLRNFYKLQDEKASEEELTKAFEALWKEYKKEFGEQEQKAVEDYKVQHKENLKRLLPKPGRSVDAVKKNTDAIRLAIKSCEKKNPLLAEKGKALIDLINSCLEVKDEKGEVTDERIQEELDKYAAEIEQRMDEVIGLMWNASIETLRDMYDNATDDVEIDAVFRPDNFLSVMQTVIKSYQGRTLLRLGVDGMRIKKKIDAEE